MHVSYPFEKPSHSDGSGIECLPFLYTETDTTHDSEDPLSDDLVKQKSGCIPTTGSPADNGRSLERV